jgi:hypothetical protein
VRSCALPDLQPVSAVMEVLDDVPLCYATPHTNMLYNTCGRIHAAIASMHLFLYRSGFVTIMSTTIQAGSSICDLHAAAGFSSPHSNPGRHTLLLPETRPPDETRQHRSSTRGVT